MKNRYYHYDRERCAFVEVRRNRSQNIARAAVAAVGVLLLATALTWTLDRVFQTPQELALLDENAALRSQLADVSGRIADVSTELEKLREHDEELYRTLFNAEGISEDVRQVGTGGTDPYPEFSRFSVPTSNLLSLTASRIDQLERQLSLQNDSYRELTALAANHEVRLAEMPAILPVNGPITSGYGTRLHPVLKVRRMHGGLDFHAPRGTPVYATGDGVIEETATGSGYGRYVVIKHATAGYETLYGHLSRVPREITRGKKVKRGDVIGYSGATGLVNAPHLHYEVRDLEGRSLNPIFFVAPSMTPSEYERLLHQAENTTLMFD